MRPSTDIPTHRLAGLPTSLFAWFVFSFLLLTGTHAFADETTAQAGWAEVEITPPLGLEMGGRGPTETVGKTVLDPLMAQVLYLEDAKGTGFVLASFDLVGMSHELSDRIRLSIVHELGVDWNLIVLNHSHTHSGPQMIHVLFAGVGPLPRNQAEYFDSVVEKTVAAARVAAKSMQAVKVEVFEGKSQVAINRRGKNHQGASAMVPNPSGPIAEKVWVMKLTPLNGESPAVVFSYACHPVIVYGPAPSEISADFPGVARNILRKELGQHAHIQFVQGLAGDVRPRVLADIPNHRWHNTTDALQLAGSQLAHDVLTAMAGNPKPLNLDLAGSMERPFLPRDQPPSRDVYESLLKTAQSKSQQTVAQYWLARYHAGTGFAKGDAWPVGLIRLADNQWVCYFAGEPCVEWGPKVAQWLAPRDVVMWGYSQESITYLPTEEMLPEGGYEVVDCNRARASSPAPFGPGINDAIRQSVLRQLSLIEGNEK